MKKINYFLATSAAALLLVASPMLASAHNDKSGTMSMKLNIEERVGAHEGRNDDDIGMHDEHKHVRSSIASTTKSMRATVGVVTAINGSTFTISPVGHKATTTVSTNSTTIFRANGHATSSNALQVGSRVALIGAPTSDTSINASMVRIFTRGFGFFKHILFH